MKLILRILALPFVFVWLMIAALAHACVWALDPTYDHKAALSAYAHGCQFMKTRNPVKP